MKYDSIIESRGRVEFPEFLAERVYMKEFYKDKGLPEELSRWQPSIDIMLDGVDSSGPIYLMIDEAFVKEGTSHRREGVHIDGYWNPGISAHGGGHRPTHLPTPSHGPRHLAGRWDLPKPWSHSTFEEPEGIILVSNVFASRGFKGEFNGEIGEGGDCSKIDLSGLLELSMEPNRVYAGNVTALHESLKVEKDCYRQLIRLNVPGWTV